MLDPIGVSEAAELSLARGGERIAVAFSETGEIRVER
jgi:hypothetical protein